MDNGSKSRVLKSVRPQEPVRMPAAPKKSGRAFWWVFGVTAAALFAALAVALILLHQFLTAYEKSQPIHAAREAFDRYFASEDFTEALRLSGFEGSEYEDAAVVSRQLRALGGGRELILKEDRSASFDGGTVQYSVGYADPVQPTLDGDGNQLRDPQGYALSQRTMPVKIAVMTFVKTDKSLGFGLKEWKFSSLEMNGKNLAGKKSVTVTVPRGTAVALNGKTLPDTCIASTEESPYNKFLPEGTPGIYWDTYHVGGLILDGQVSCADKDGNPVEIAQVLEKTDEEGRTVDISQADEKIYTAQLCYREDLEAEYKDFVLKGIEAYANYIQNKGSRASVAKYVDTKSAFYRLIAENPSGFVYKADAVRYDDEIADQFYAYSDDVISCRVKMVQVMERAGHEDFKEVLEMTVFLHRVNGTFLIYDRMAANS